MTWNIDPSHTRVNFSVRHMMISWVHGNFSEVNGIVDFDPENPLASRVDVEIGAGSLNTGDAKRDGHLKSPDFLDVENYPVLIFKSKRIEVIDDNHGRLIGDLTVKDITREVELDLEYAGMAKSPWGATSAGFTAITRLNRKDWNLNWNVALETGGVLVGDTINTTIEIEIVKQPETVTAAA